MRWGIWSSSPASPTPRDHVLCTPYQAIRAASAPPSREESTDEIHLSVSLGEKAVHVTLRTAPALQSADTERQRAVPQILLRAIEVG